LLEHTLAPATRLCKKILENSFDVPEPSKCNNSQLSVTQKTQLEQRAVVASCAATHITIQISVFLKVNTDRPDLERGVILGSHTLNIYHKK
jgi:hypothetical protein